MGATPIAIPAARARAGTSQVHASALAGWSGVVDAADLPDIQALRDQRPDDISRPSIPLAEFVALTEDLARRRRDVALAWNAGLGFDFATLGALGDPVLAAPRVGVALRRLVDLFVVLQDCTEMTLTCEDDLACVSYRILDPDIWPRHHDAMFTLGIVAAILRRAGAVQAGWDKIEFAFEADQHSMIGAVGAVVAAPVSFGADANQIRFPASLLDRALPCARAACDARVISRAVVEHRRRLPLVERLAQVLWRDMNCRPIEQDRIAREIGMSSRTMRRKLAEAGASFQDVLDECRMRQALFEFRTRPDLSIAEIALRLGYAEHSNFTRAFHRWAGVSPQVWRTGMQATTH